MTPNATDLERRATRGEPRGARVVLADARALSSESAAPSASDPGRRSAVLVAGIVVLVLVLGGVAFAAALRSTATTADPASPTAPADPAGPGVWLVPPAVVGDLERDAGVQSGPVEVDSDLVVVGRTVVERNSTDASAAVLTHVYVDPHDPPGPDERAPLVVWQTSATDIDHDRFLVGDTDAPVVASDGLWSKDLGTICPPDSSDAGPGEVAVGCRRIVVVWSADDVIVVVDADPAVPVEAVVDGLEAVAQTDG